MKIILSLMLAFLAFGANASKLGDLNKFGVSSTGNSAKVGAWGSGSWDSAIPMAKPSGGWSYAGNYGIPQAATGPTMSLGASGEVFFADRIGTYGGVRYPFQATHEIPGTTLVDAIGAIAGGPIGVGLFALPFALEWLTSSGGRVDPANPGALQRTDPTVCTVGPCYEYKLTSGTGASVQTNTTSGTCSAFIPVLKAGSATVWAGATVNNVTSTQCFINRPYFGDVAVFNFATISIAVQSATWLPSSMDDIAPYMKQTSFDPRVIGEILDKGGDIPFPAPTVTGPSEILGPKTEIQNPDGTKTISQPKSYFTPSGDTITNTKNETIVTVVNVDNSISSVTTTTVTPTASAAKEPVNTEDPCLLNPDRLGCSKFGEPVASDELEKETVAVTVTPVAFAGSATCPGPISFNVAGHQYAVEYTPLCEKLAVLKFLFLAMAGFVAAYVVASMFKV